MEKEIYTEILIDASAEKVWQILTDFEKFPEWNPFVINVSGQAKRGETLKIKVKIPERQMLNFKPSVLRAKQNAELRWVGTLPLKAFRGEHFYKIESLSPTKIRFVHGEYFSGWLVGLIWALLGEKIEKGYVLMNRALKERAETR